MKIITLTLAVAPPKKRKENKLSARQVVSTQQIVVIMLLLLLLSQGEVQDELQKELIRMRGQREELVQDGRPSGSDSINLRVLGPGEVVH